MKYTVTNCAIPENLLSKGSVERFSDLLRKKGIASWSYNVGKKTLVLIGAPAGLESILREYGLVEVSADA